MKEYDDLMSEKQRGDTRRCVNQDMRRGLRIRIKIVDVQSYLVKNPQREQQKIFLEAEISIGILISSFFD